MYSWLGFPRLRDAYADAPAKFPCMAGQGISFIGAESTYESRNPMHYSGERAYTVYIGTKCYATDVKRTAICLNVNVHIEAALACQISLDFKEIPVAHCTAISGMSTKSEFPKEPTVTIQS